MNPKKIYKEEGCLGQKSHDAADTDEHIYYIGKKTDREFLEDQAANNVTCDNHRKTHQPCLAYRCGDKAVHCPEAGHGYVTYKKEGLCQGDILFLGIGTCQKV